MAVWAKGQMKWAKKVWNNSTYDITHKKIQNPKQKFFFHCRPKTCQIFWVFKQFFSAIVGDDILAQKHVQTAGF